MRQSAPVGSDVPLLARADTLTHTVLLTNEQHYHQDLADLPWITDRQVQRAIVEWARAGDSKAREAILGSGLHYVEYFASPYSSTYSWVSARLEYLELVAVGNLALVEKLDRALVAENPFAYLNVVARGAIHNYCRKYRSLIVTPSDRVPPLEVESLDRALADEDDLTLVDLIVAPATPLEGDEPDYTLLHQAVEALAPGQRLVITRHYGLFNTTPIGISLLGKEVYGRDNGSAYKLKHQALTHLFRTLASVYPHDGETYRSPSSRRTPDPSSPQKGGSLLVQMTPEKVQRLEWAMVQLKARGTPISGRRLAEEAHIHHSVAHAYLKQQRSSPALVSGGGDYASA